MIPVTKPFLPPKTTYDQYIQRTWDNNWLTNNGPLLRELEDKVKSYLDASSMIFVSNGTIAIQIAIKALGITGDIITTPFSYVATTSAPAWENCRLVFADIDPYSYNIDPAKVEAAITKDTQAILATHVFGNPIEVEAIEQIAKKHKLKVIYDAAHCFGVNYDGTSIFDFGDISTLSTHATKIFHTVEGGFMTSVDPEVVRQINLMKNFGHDGVDRFSAIGINGKNSEFHSAMGLANLHHIDEILATRKSQYERYRSALSGRNDIQLQSIHPKADYNYSYFPVVFNNEETLLKVQEDLKAHDIVPRRYFFPSLNTLDYVDFEPAPVAEKISKTILCLPLYHALENTDIDRICDIVSEAVG